MSTERYTVEVDNGVTIIRGAVPIRDMGKLTGLADKGEVMATDLNRALNATMVFGMQPALDALRERLGRSDSQPPEVINLDWKAQLAEWFARGAVGMSSETMAKQFLGTEVTDLDYGHPHDAFDFRRCCLLLEWVPSLRHRLDELRGLSPIWSGLVEDWENLEALLEEEAPGWRFSSPSTRCPRLHARLKTITDCP